MAEWYFQRGTFRPNLIDALDLQAGQRVLDLGCGPARLAILHKRAHRSLEVTAADCDPEMLFIAERNVRKAKVDVQVVKQDLGHLTLKGPYDRIYSALVFHHLTVQSKKRALKKISELLAPGGRFVLGDFCQSERLKERMQFLRLQFFDGFKTTSPHAEGWLERNLPLYFKHVERIHKVSTFVGPMGVFVCRKL